MSSSAAAAAAAAPVVVPNVAVARNNNNTTTTTNTTTTATTSTPPLLLLMDGILSQDPERIEHALRDVKLYLRRREHHNKVETPVGPSCWGNAKATVGSPYWSIMNASSPTIVDDSGMEYEWSLSTATRVGRPSFTQWLEWILMLCPELAGQPSAHDGSYPLHFAASLGNVDIVKQLHERFPSAACTPNAKGKIPLHYAAREGRYDVVQYLLQQQPQTAQMASHKFKLALHFAAGDGHVRVCKLLLQYYPHGAKLPSAKGKIALHFCARWGHIEIANALLKIYPDGIRALDWEGSLPLHDAAREGQFHMCMFLLQHFPHGAQVSNLRHEIPLFPAVRSNELPLIRLLVSAWPQGGKSVLQTVSNDDNVQQWDWKIVELLLRGAVNAPLDDDDDDDDDDTPPTIEAATVEARSSSATVAATSVVPPATATYSMVSECLVSASRGDNTANEEVDRKVSPTANNNNKKRPPIDSNTAGAATPVACKRVRGDPEDTSLLMASTESSSFAVTASVAAARPYRRFLPLHAALQCGASVPVLQAVLAQRWEDVTQMDEYGRTPLHWAVCLTKKVSVVQIEGVSNASGGSDSSSINQLKMKKKKNGKPKKDKKKSSGSLPPGCQCVVLGVSFVQQLVTPETTRVRDAVGQCLPLHLALQHQASLPIIDCLLESYPQSAMVPCVIPDDTTNDTYKPLHWACHNDCDTDVIYRLLRIDPSVLKRRATSTAGAPVFT